MDENWLKTIVITIESLVQVFVKVHLLNTKIRQYGYDALRHSHKKYDVPKTITFVNIKNFG